MEQEQSSMSTTTLQITKEGSCFDFNKRIPPSLFLPVFPLSNCKAFSVLHSPINCLSLLHPCRLQVKQNHSNSVKSAILT